MPYVHGELFDERHKFFPRWTQNAIEGQVQSINFNTGRWLLQPSGDDFEML